MSTGKVILGAVAGLAIGATVGMLFAPYKGSNTRKKLSDKANDQLSDLKNKYNGAIDALTSKLDSVQQKGENLYEEGKDIAQNTTATA